MIAIEIQKKLQTLGDPQRAQVQQKLFKTGPGEYGEGNIFIGLRVPEIRKMAKEHQALALSEIIRLLQSPIHEARFLALLILIRVYRNGEASIREQIYLTYLQHTRFINNWDLVDASAAHIVGARLMNGSRDRLHELALSNLIWDRRIAVIATFHFIKLGEYSDTLDISGLLLKDPEDLIHKAVGWMLREIGKRDRPTEESFLRATYRIMPRTMLRYAIEKFPEALRLQYLRGEI